ncbi:YugN-like family protein [Virgibacillus sp. 6R]|uniref:YugN-like family protein n=1 Tax=Metabacillus sp. 22489 TaxID=3453928 RepID=UPI0011A5E788
MLEIKSRLEGKAFPLYELEQKLKPLGYDIGGNWEYDHGYLDYKIDSEVGYQFLRVPFQAINGELDTPGVVVQIGTPFLLSHKYQIGLDDHARIGNVSASFNQFQEPEDKDATFPNEYIENGKELVKQLEDTLL